MEAELKTLLEDLFPGMDFARPLLAQMSSIERVTLVVELEKNYGIEIIPLEIKSTHFDSLQGLETFLKSKA